MPSLKPILTAFAVALALSAADQAPASAQNFISRMDQGKKQCEGNHGTFKQENPSSPTSDTYTCTRTKDHKIDNCVASTGKCTTKDMPAPKPASTAPAKSLAGTGDVSKDALKKICARNKEWMFTEEKSSSAFSCMDTAAGIAINCKKNNDCTEAHTQVRAH